VTVQEVESEVVGFNGQSLFLMPLEEVEGIVPGARVYARISPEGHTAGKQLPLGPQLLGRVLDGSAKPLDGLPAPETGYRAALITPPFNPLQRTPIDRCAGRRRARHQLPAHRRSRPAHGAVRRFRRR
jgi:flagellum-specific ATP synthase